jgi:hypothetical protein
MWITLCISVDIVEKCVESSYKNKLFVNKNVDNKELGIFIHSLV